MTTISLHGFIACLHFIAASPAAAPQGREPPPLLDPSEFEALLNQAGPGLFFAFFVYVPLVVIGAVAWRARGKARPPERLPSRDRALPPPPRGPDA